MIIVNININIRLALVDIGSTLNICNIDLLPKIKIDSAYLATSSLIIHGFDNVKRQDLGTIVLPL